MAYTVIHTPFIRTVLSKNVTLAANAYDSIAIPSKDGYQMTAATPYASGTGSTMDAKVMIIEDASVSSSGLCARIVNKGSQSRSWTLYCIVLYTKI